MNIIYLIQYKLWDEWADFETYDDYDEAMHKFTTQKQISPDKEYRLIKQTQEVIA